MTEIPNKTGYLGQNGKVYSIFESLESFIKSSETECVMYAFCTLKKKKGKRWLLKFEFRYGNYDFFNIEHTPIGWVKHDIEELEPNKAYRMLIIKEYHCVNDVQIKYSKEIKQD